jgi:hypothetical protein
VFVPIALAALAFLAQSVLFISGPYIHAASVALDNTRTKSTTADYRVASGPPENGWLRLFLCPQRAKQSARG